VAGGQLNIASGEGATVGGGAANIAAGLGATVPGGAQNSAVANWSFAAGHRAIANHNGSFVWADDSAPFFFSTATNQFAIRASSGVMIQSSNTALDLRGGGTIRVAGAGTNAVTPVFIHRATATNTFFNETVIDHPHSNNDPNAIVFVTQNWNPGGTAGTYNPHAVGVYYSPPRWRIFNQDGISMPTNAAFNVMIVKP
jgi:hypothetical protein